MNSISLVFQETVHRDDLDFLERIPGCVGASAYQNTVNLYFKCIKPETLFAVTLAARRIAAEHGGAVSFLHESISPRADAAG